MNQEVEIPHSIPSGWTWTTIGDLASEVEKINPNDDPEREFIYLDIASIENRTNEITSPKRYLGKAAPSRARQLVRSGDILFSTVRTYLKNIAMVNEIYDGQLASTGFCVIRPLDPISRKLVLYYVQGNSFLNPLTLIQRGTSYPAVRDSDVFAQPIPIPPLNEQHRIVAKVEELFTKLDAGAKSLQTIKVQLKRYRQSVLKSAFEGKLTEEWRRTHRDGLEPASKILECIREEQRKTAAKKYVPPSLDTINLSELPEGWAWTRVGEVATRIQYGSSEKATEDSSGVPVLRMGNIQEGNLIFEDLKYFSKDYPQLNDFMLDSGDILFNRTNSAELVGKTAVYEHWHPKVAFASYLIRVKVNDRIYDPQILAFFINSYYGRRYITSVVSQQVGQANVNGTKLFAMPIPLTSLSEQKAIGEEIKRRFSIAEDVEKTVVNGLRQTKKLRHSILKRAFEGKLVHQDPSDEPASVLLERIKSLKAPMIQDQKAKKERQNLPKQRRLM